MVLSPRGRNMMVLVTKPPRGVPEGVSNSENPLSIGDLLRATRAMIRTG